MVLYPETQGLDLGIVIVTNQATRERGIAIAIFKSPPSDLFEDEAPMAHVVFSASKARDVAEALVKLVEEIETIGQSERIQ
jgi:hypothetical protein